MPYPQASPSSIQIGGFMRRLAVDFEDIAIAMEEQEWSNEYYLDTQAGELVLIPSEISSLESFDEK